MAEKWTKKIILPQKNDAVLTKYHDSYVLSRDNRVRLLLTVQIVTGVSELAGWVPAIHRVLGILFRSDKADIGPELDWHWSHARNSNRFPSDDPAMTCRTQVHCCCECLVRSVVQGWTKPGLARE